MEKKIMRQLGDWESENKSWIFWAAQKWQGLQEAIYFIPLLWYEANRLRKGKNEEG